MNKLINQLPDEIINIIISYTYNFQPINLRKDIISYVSTKNNIKNIFFQRKYPLSYIKHLVFHIHGYIKGIPNLYSNCKDKLKEFTNRICILRLQNLLYLNNYNFSNEKLQYIFNFYWGYFNIEERNEFINIHIIMDKSKMP